MSPTGRFRILGVGVLPQTFTDLASARIALQAAKDAQVFAERYLANIHARTRVDGGYVGEFCDLSQLTAPPADYYSVLNYVTGQYEDRGTYDEARSRIVQLFALRDAFLSSSATVENEWLDADTGALSWIIYETLNDPKP